MKNLPAVGRAVALLAVSFLAAGLARAVVLYPVPPADPVEHAAGAAGEAAAPRLIRLLAVVFDPLADALPEFTGLLPEGPTLGTESGPDRYRLIQFEGPATAAIQRELARRGIEVVGPVPNHALVVRLPGGSGDDLLRAVPGRRWSGPLVPGVKLSPELLLRLAEPRAVDGGLELDVSLFPGEDPAALARAVAARFERSRLFAVQRSRLPRISLAVAAAELGPLVGALVREPAVAFVSVRHPLELHNDQSVWIGQSYDRAHGPGEAAAAAPASYPLAATLWNHGLTGAGQIVAVADTGLDHEMCFFEDPAHPVTPQVVAPPASLALDPAHRKLLAYNAPLAVALDHDDTFRHGTHVTASAVGDDRANLAGSGSAGHDHGDGMAPAAKLVFEDISGSATSVCGVTILVTAVENLLEQEYAAGARISTNSWGSSVEGFDVATLETDLGAWEHEDLLVLFSAGNNGGAGLGGFARCKDCVTVGASENYDESFSDAFGILDPENMTNFSSRGPTPDGRLKPDIVAPGSPVRSARSPVQYFSNASDPVCDAGDPTVCFPGFGGCYHVNMADSCHVDVLSGTSMATPLVAGLAALARQYFVAGYYPSGQPTAADVRVPSAALLKAVLLNGARNMTGHRYTRGASPVDHGPLEDAPSNTQGWGRVLVDDALYFVGEPRRLRVVDLPHASGLATGQTVRRTFTVTSAAEPLKLTLAWSDPPGLALSFGALVDDLDLALAVPGGAVFRGNQWTADNVGVPGDKQSLANPPGKDAVNNVEGISILAPAPGLYTVTVQGANVPGGSGSLTQGAALVVTGAVADCTSASAPASLGTTAVASTHVDLAWQAVPAALGYNLYRNDTACGSPLAADSMVTLPLSPTSYTDASVAPSSTYHYTVRAVVSAQGCETADSNCVTVTTPEPGPPPVQALTAKRGSHPGAIDLNWDASTCPAEGYHVLYGALGTVSSLALGGAVCHISTSGNATWPGTPPGNLWFVVVADDGAATEGSWGTDSNGAQRAGGTPSGLCGLTSRDNSATCR